MYIYIVFLYTTFYPLFLLMLILLYPYSVCRDWYECASECTWHHDICCCNIRLPVKIGMDVRVSDTMTHVVVTYVCLSRLAWMCEWVYTMTHVVVSYVYLSRWHVAWAITLVLVNTVALYYSHTAQAGRKCPLLIRQCTEQTLQSCTSTTAESGGKNKAITDVDQSLPAPSYGHLPARRCIRVLL